MNAVSVACSHGDFLPGRSRRYDDAAIAVVEEDVRAVGFGEPRRALEEFFSVHGGGRQGKTEREHGPIILKPVPQSVSNDDHPTTILCVMGEEGGTEFLSIYWGDGRLMWLSVCFWKSGDIKPTILRNGTAAVPRQGYLSSPGAAAFLSTPRH